MKLTREQVSRLKANLGCSTHATLRATLSGMTPEQRAEAFQEVVQP